MSTNDIPQVTIKHQAQTTTPVTGDNTLVDDPVALVDDPVALVGGPNSSIDNLSVAIVNPSPKLTIKRNR